VIQITDDPSAERTAPPRSTHVRNGDVSSFLIQQGGRRGWGGQLQQQHDGVVELELRGIPAGLLQAPREEEEVLERRGAAPGAGLLPPSHPSTIYRREGEGAAPP
jgi:hypothetical protein